MSGASVVPDFLYPWISPRLFQTIQRQGDLANGERQEVKRVIEMVREVQRPQRQLEGGSGLHGQTSNPIVGQLFGAGGSPNTRRFDQAPESRATRNPIRRVHRRPGARRKVPEVPQGNQAIARPSPKQMWLADVGGNSTSSFIRLLAATSHRRPILQDAQRLCKGVADRIRTGDIQNHNLAL